MAYRILVSAPVPFGFRSYWDLVVVGPRGLGLGLDNKPISKSVIILEIGLNARIFGACAFVIKGHFPLISDKMCSAN